MKPLTRLFSAVLLSSLTSLAYADWALGEIRRVDVENKRLTIKHGEIKSLDMPPMTMVFYVTNSEMLSGLKVADRIEFKVIEEGKKYKVTDIRKRD